MQWLSMYLYKAVVNSNKSNTTAGAVQVEANLLEQLNDNLHIRKLKYC